MLVHIDSAWLNEEDGSLIVVAPQLQQVIERFAHGGDDGGFDLRFAGARVGTTPYVIIGLRQQGRGFDVAIPVRYWSELAAGPSELVLCTTPSERNIIVPWPDDAFEAFLAQCSAQATDNPSLIALAEIVNFFDTSIS